MRLEVGGLEDMLMSMQQMARVPTTVIDGMLNAEADVIVEAQKESGRRHGLHKTGSMLNSIKKGKAKVGGTNAYIDVRPTGRNAESGSLNTEVAFVKEYGARGVPAAPFIQEANEKKADEAAEKAADVYDEWLDSLY